MKARALAPGALLIAIGLLATACTAGVREAEPYDGLWRSEGFGQFLEIADAIDLYEHTAVSCALVAGGSARGFSGIASLEGGRLVLRDAGRVVRYDQVDRLPGNCVERFRTDDLGRTLEVAIATFGEHYPFLDEGWAGRAESARATAPTDGGALLASMVAAVAPLAEPQIRIGTGDDRLVPGGVWSIERPAVESVRAHIAAGGFLTGGPLVLPSGHMLAGQTPGGAAYIAITALVGVDGDSAAQEARFAADLDRALSRDPQAPGVIVDLRANPGGSDRLALLVATRFVAEERIVATREVRVGGTSRFVDGGMLVVRPLPIGPYPGGVVVLIGPGTVGAAEVLTLALRGLPAVTVIGERSAGSLSPLLVRTLPNGWTIGLPHQRVRDADGAQWQGIGIPPDELVVATIADYSAGRDPVLDRATAIITSGR